MTYSLPIKIAHDPHTLVFLPDQKDVADWFAGIRADVATCIRLRSDPIEIVLFTHGIDTPLLLQFITVGALDDFASDFRV